MAECKCISTCPFYNNRLAKTPLMSEILKWKYCFADSASCARYIIEEKLGESYVPDDLVPNRMDRVYQILNVQKMATAA